MQVSKGRKRAVAWFSGVGLSDLDNLIVARAFAPETQVLASVWFRSPLSSLPRESMNGVTP